MTFSSFKNFSWSLMLLGASISLFFLWDLGFDLPFVSLSIHGSSIFVELTKDWNIFSSWSVGISIVLLGGLIFGFSIWTGHKLMEIFFKFLLIVFCIEGEFLTAFMVIFIFIIMTKWKKKIIKTCW